MLCCDSVFTTGAAGEPVAVENTNNILSVKAQRHPHHVIRGSRLGGVLHDHNNTYTYILRKAVPMWTLDWGEYPRQTEGLSTSDKQKV